MGRGPTGLEPVVSAAAAERYRDDHLHLLACAAARRSVDVSAATSIDDLLGKVRHAVKRRATLQPVAEPADASPACRLAPPSPQADCAADQPAGLPVCRSASHATAESWLRVWGYDDALLDERRHPTVSELDAATPGIPAVLHHLTGHVVVLNTAAGRALGRAGGELLIERQEVLEAVPRPDRAQTVTGVAGILADLAAAGIVECTDATHTNDLVALELLADAAVVAVAAGADEATPPVRVTAMVGADRLESLGGLRFGATVRGCVTPALGNRGRASFEPSGHTRAPQASAAQSANRDTHRDLLPDAQRGARMGNDKVMPPHGDADEVEAELSGWAGVRIGHAKVMPPHDDDSAIAELVAEARAHGFPVAIHAMDIDTLQAALDALEAHPPTPAAPAPSEPDRIEHCALALPEQLDRIARLGISVVTQPSFVTRRARKYREQLSATEQAWLWPLADLVRRGIRVTLSSDAPAAPADPAEWMAAAAGRDLASPQRLDPATARLLCLADGTGCAASPAS